MIKTVATIFFACGLLILHPAKNAAAEQDGFVFSFQDQTFPVSHNDLAAWKSQQLISPSTILNPPVKPLQADLMALLGQAPKSPANNSRIYHYKLNSIYNFVQGIAEKIDRPEVEPILKIQNNIIAAFTAPQDGFKVDVYKTAFEALKTLEIGKTNLGLTVYDTSPQEQLSETNALGIKELIAEGVSNFKGSPKNRRHNIAVGLEKFKGTIVPKGAEFSFNNILGPVEAAQGFLPELVIKKEGTVPEFGGGLCQVSTTTFRAAMNAGLPITARRNHAYAVQYYAPQGTDATIYPGSSDLKFINDTPGAILIWPYEKDKETLIFDFYGTKDSRQVTLEKPVQYDRKPDGSMKATWTRQVTKDGETRTDVFKSVYQSPALFHKQEQFVTATTTPAGLQIPPQPAT